MTDAEKTLATALWHVVCAAEYAYSNAESAGDAHDKNGNEYEHMTTLREGYERAEKILRAAIGWKSGDACPAWITRIGGDQS